MCDGGYVMADRLEPSDGCAYSIGVGPDTSWDVDMADRGWEVFQYDHTVEDAPHRHARCHFHKLGLGAHDHDVSLRRLDTLFADNGHDDRGGHILKVDIEGHEWDCLDVLADDFFIRFDQIVAEIHWLDHLTDDAFRSKYFRVMQKLGKHHTCIHIHANNYADLVTQSGIAIPPVIEVTFVRRAHFDFTMNTDTSPGALDIANHAGKPDIYLGLFEFPWHVERGTGLD